MAPLVIWRRPAYYEPALTSSQGARTKFMPEASMSQRLQKCADEINQAQAQVEEAMNSYSRGGSLSALNKANARLAQAHNDFYKVDGGTIVDNRPFNR
jgi:hypothetical protein